MSRFAGKIVRCDAEAVEGHHRVRLLTCRFPDGSEGPYVEVSESHDGGDKPRIFALSTLVHLAQNVTDAELWQIGARPVSEPSAELLVTSARSKPIDAPLTDDELAAVLAEPRPDLDEALRRGSPSVTRCWKRRRCRGCRM